MGKKKTCGEEEDLVADCVCMRGRCCEGEDVNTGRWDEGEDIAS